MCQRRWRESSPTPRGSSAEIVARVKAKRALTFELISTMQQSKSKTSAGRFVSPTAARYVRSRCLRLWGLMAKNGIIAFGEPPFSGQVSNRHYQVLSHAERQPSISIRDSSLRLE